MLSIVLQKKTVLQQNGYRGNEELRQWDGKDNILNLLLIDLHFSFPRGVFLFSIIVSYFFFWLLVLACFCFSTVIKVHWLCLHIFVLKECLL